jgi:hypothetical protein
MPIDIVILLWLGAAFGWCARERLRADGLWAQPSLGLVGSFILLVVWPTGAYFYLVHPSWSWLFLVDPDRLPGLVVLTIMALHAAVLLGAFALAGWLVRTGRDALLRWGVLAMPVLIVLAIVLLRARLFSYGSYRDFQAGQSVPIFDVKLGYVLVAIWLGAMAAAAVVGWELTKDGRRAASR